MNPRHRAVAPRISVALLLLATVFQASIAGAEESPADSAPAPAAAAVRPTSPAFPISC